MNSEITYADYVVHFLGYAMYVVGKHDQVNAICATSDFVQNNIEILSRDSSELDYALSLGHTCGDRIQRPSIRDYLKNLPSEGPIPIELYGIGLVKMRELKFYPLNQLFDARAFRRIPRRWAAASLADGTGSVGRSRFAVADAMIDGSGDTPWTPQFALGAKCLQLECRAIRTRKRRHEARERFYEKYPKYRIGQC